MALLEFSNVPEKAGRKSGCVSIISEVFERYPNQVTNGYAKVDIEFLQAKLSLLWEWAFKISLSEYHQELISIASTFLNIAAVTK